MDLASAVWNGERVTWINFEQSCIQEETGNFKTCAETEIDELFELFAEDALMQEVKALSSEESNRAKSST